VVFVLRSGDSCLLHMASGTWCIRGRSIISDGICIDAGSGQSATLSAYQTVDHPYSRSGDRPCPWLATASMFSEHTIHRLSGASLTFSARRVTRVAFHLDLATRKASVEAPHPNVLMPLIVLGGTTRIPNIVAARAERCSPPPGLPGCGHKALGVLTLIVSRPDMLITDL
jgi:hypothetical protein